MNELVLVSRSGFQDVRDGYGHGIIISGEDRGRAVEGKGGVPDGPRQGGGGVGAGPKEDGAGGGVARGHAVEEWGVGVVGVEGERRGGVEQKQQQECREH